ncbi:MAG: caspase family protein [Bacteroidales bacterium]|nr:caspase family protein [Bacteroidales bacterium]
MQSQVIMASISFDNKIGLTVEDNEVLILWELKTGRQLQSFKNIMAADFSENGNTIELVTNDYTFKTTDFAGNVISESPIKNSGNDRYNRLNLSFYQKSGTLLENGRIYTRDKGFIGRIMVEKYGTEQDYSESANLLAIPFNNEVSICKVPGGELVKEYTGNLYNRPGYTENIKFTRFSPDGKLLMVGNNYSLDIQDLATGESIYTFDYHDDNNSRRFLNNANFSADGKQLLILCSDIAMLVDIPEKKILWTKPQTAFTFNEYSSRRGIAKFSDDGKTVLIGYLKNLHFLDAATGNVVSKIQGITTREFTYNHWIEKTKKLIIEENYEELKALNWNLGLGSLEKITTGYRSNFENHFSVNSDGTKLYQFFTEINQNSNTQKIFQFQATRDQEFEKQYLSGNDKYHAVTLRQNNLPFSDPGYFKIVVSETAGKKKLWEKPGVQQAAFNNKGTSIAVVIFTNDKQIIQVLNPATGALIKNYPVTNNYNFNSIAFSPADTYLQLDAGDFHLLINATDGSVIEIPKILPNSNMWYGGKITPDEKWLIVSDQFGLLQFYDILAKAWNSSRSIKAYSNAVLSLSFSTDSHFMFANERESNVKLFSLERDELLATLYPVSETGDWAVVTPDGRFDASPEAQKDIYFVKGLNTFPLEVLYEQFYTPRLLPRLLAGEVFNPVDAELDNLKKAPVVKISYEQLTRNLLVEDEGILSYTNTTGLAEITVNATSEGDKIDEIRLFHNGKIVNLATRGLFVTDDATNTDSKKYTINLMPGQNSFRAIALNSQRTESKPDEIWVTYQTESGTVNTTPNTPVTGGSIDKVDKNATLHLIVVGINQYQNKSMVLNYALADATAFKDEMEKDAKSIITNIKTYFVTDNTANKSGITDAFGQVQKSAKPQDVFVFYYAGHGVIGKDKEFYLVPNDVSDLKNVQTELESKGIPAKLLQKYAIDIAAQKQLFILDACQSAGAFNEMLSADGDQQKSIAVVSRSTGTHWMAASGAQQYANEFSQLGHGAFTYVLLEALKGSAATDKMITVNGLKNYLQQGVPELMKKYSGTLQYPASYGFGNDFPVEMMK